MVLLLHLDEGSGYSVKDTSSFGNEGEIKNGDSTIWSKGKFGEAVLLNGTNQYIKIADGVQNNLDLGMSDFTLEAWVKTTQSGNYAPIIGKKWDISTTPGYAVWMSPRGNLIAAIGDGVNAWLMTSDKVVNDGAWHHIAVVVDRDDGNSSYICVDGVDVTGNKYGEITAVGLIDNSRMFGIGTNGVTNYFYSGVIDEVKVFSRIRSLEEIKRSYAEGTVELRLGFDIDVSPTIDTSGNGNNSEVNGAEWVEGGKSGGAFTFDGNGQYII